MASFEGAAPTIFAHEGGWQNEPTDPGGETNFGLSTNGIIKSHNLGPKDLELDPATFGQPGYLKALKREIAEKIYRRLYWLPAYEQIADQTTATKLCDAAINMGWISAHECAQRALARLVDPKLQIDGVLGPESLGAIAAVPAATFLAEFSDQLAQRYVADLVARPAMIKTWERVWLKRAGYGLPADQAAALVTRYTGQAQWKIDARAKKA